MKNEQYKTGSDAGDAAGVSQCNEEPEGGGRPARGKGARLVADLSEFLTRRKHGRSGLYLPLVRVDPD